jgi:hypothetical protein
MVLPSQEFHRLDPLCRWATEPVFQVGGGLIVRVKVVLVDHPLYHASIIDAPGA